MPYDIARVLTSVQLSISSRLRTLSNTLMDALRGADGSERRDVECFNARLIDEWFSNREVSYPKAEGNL